MPTRNLPAEKNAISVFQRQRGALPSSSEDWAAVHRIAYPTVNDLPDEFKATEAASYYDAGVNKPPVPQAGAIPNVNSSADPAYIQSLTDQTNQAKTQSDQAFQAYDDMPSGNEALRVLQEAIKAKANPRDFSQAPIGESEIFKQAGVGGYGALASSLAARGKEFDANRADFANVVSQMADVYKTQATTAQRRYEKSVEDYQFLSNQLNKTLEQMRQDEQQIKIIRLQNDLQKELREMDYNNDLSLRNTPTIQDRLDAEEKGYFFRGNELLEDTDLNRGIVNGFDISSYATDPNHEKAVASIITNIGKFNTIQDVDNYIQQKYPGSPITGQMISQASAKNRVPWEMLVAMMEQDSSLGTKGKGARTFNPGNVGNDDSGNVRNYGSWQAGVDAVGKWLAKHQVSPEMSNARKSAQDVRATAQAIFDGSSTMKVSDLPQAKRDAVNQELVRLKNEALRSGDLVGVMRASAGGDKLDVATIQSFEKVASVISQLSSLKASVKNELTGPIVGTLRSKNPWDSKAKIIEAQLRATVPNLARGVYGEVGVLTDQDIKNYMQTLPNLKTEKDVTDALLAMTVKSVQNAVENKISINAASGRDMSGFVQVYNDLKGKTDEMLAPYKPASTNRDVDYVRSLNLPK